MFSDTLIRGGFIDFLQVYRRREEFPGVLTLIRELDDILAVRINRL